MEQRRIGDSDLFSSCIGFGTWDMSATTYGNIDVKETSTVVNTAIDCGITLFDTAEVYGPYYSEELLSKVLGNKRKEIVLVSKVGFQYDDYGKNLGRNSKYDHVIERAEGCLRRMKTDFLDLLLIHWPDYETPFEETMGALEKLKKDGKIRYYGVSNFTIEMMNECEIYGHLTANQVGYNLFDRRMEAKVLGYCLDNNIGFMAYGTLAFGLLSGASTFESMFEGDWSHTGLAFELPPFQGKELDKELKVVERLTEIARRYDKSVAQLAIAWTLGHPAVSVSLVEIRNQSELEEDVGGAEWLLDDDTRAEIDEIFKEEGVPTHVDTEQAI